MSEFNGEFPTVLGEDARFKGELSFDKGVRIEGHFDGQVRSKGTLHIAESARVTADIEAANVRVEGQCKGNLAVSEKLHLLSTARLEGDLRTNRLEIADGAIFVGKVVVGQAAAAAELPMRRTSPAEAVGAVQPRELVREPTKVGPPPMSQGTVLPRPRPQDIHVPAASS